MTWSALRRARQRLVRRILLFSTAAAGAGIGAWMLLRGNENSSTFVSTVASLFVGLVTLLLALVDFFRQEPPSLDPAALADDLALNLKDQWLEEATARRLRDPRVLPLSWAATTRHITHLPRTADSRVLRMHLDGRLNGRFDEVTAQLATGYTQLPNRRLVAIGEPGAGKTVLAILLTLGLLDARETGGPVPVLLPASSWDPVREPLDAWIVRTLALPYYGGRPEIPRTLLQHGLLLPVLDGLDEIPESARRSAIRGINQAIGAERSIVVTCRAAEYEDLIRGGAPTLREAPVVEVSPVPPSDVIAYLRDVDWPEGTDWTPVYAHLRSERNSPVAAALSTPLMVTSARLVYQRLRLDPAELLDSSRFDCRYAVEQHLTDQLIDAAYAQEPDVPEEQQGGERWTAEQARRWLTFLARYLHDHRERDLAWWQMSDRLLSPWFAPALGVGIGLVLAIGSLAWIVGTDALGTDALESFPLIAGSIGGGFALLCTIVWYAAPGREPGRLSFTVRGSLGRLRHGFRNGVALTALAVAPLLVGITSVVALRQQDGPGSLDAIELYYEMFMVGLCLMIVIGLALAAHNWLNAPPHHATQVSPRNSLSQDRRSSLAGALIAGCVVSATGLLGWYTGVLSGAWLSRLVNDWAGWPGNRDADALAVAKWNAVVDPFGSNAPVIIGLTVALPGTVFAVLLLLTRAWPRFFLVRLFLAARRQLPLRLLGFLADARRRELLRQSSGVYQFRHVRLQETLAGRPLYADEPPPSRVSGTVRRRLILTAGAATALTAAVGSRSSDDSWKAFPASSPVTALAFHPGSETKIAIGAEDGSVWLWDYEGRPLSLREQRVRGKRPESAPSGVECLAYHPRHPLLAISDTVTAEVWDTRSGTLTKELLAKTFGSLDLAFSPRGDVLLATDSEEMQLWNVQADHSFSEVRVPAVGVSSYQGLAFDPATHESVILESAGRVHRYSLPSLKQNSQPLVSRAPRNMENYSSGGISIDWKDGLLAFMTFDHRTGDGVAELWRRTGPNAPWSQVGWSSAAYRVALSPTDPLLAVVDQSEHVVHIWHCERAKPRRVRKLAGHNGPITAMAFSPDGDLLATACADQTVRLWETDPWLNPLRGG